MNDKMILVLCEKPDAAIRIAKALDKNGDPQKKALGRVPYYEAKADGKRLIVVSALGHLYTVAPKIMNRDVYPVFEFEWMPKYKVERNAKETKAFIDAISKLSKEAQGFILATDYDIEGATIGYTILKYACGEKEKEAKRMKFSTLTIDEVRKSYNGLLSHIEFSAVESGVCRHFLDAMYGINLSRAMTVAVKRWSGRYATMSTGRVQGPTLNFLVEREKEIDSFVPIPYWTINVKVEINGSIYEAEYEKAIVERRAEADGIINSCKGKTGKITEIEVKKFTQNPPRPFDLGTLQTEAYNLFRLTPRRTADIAERLYLDALISYPRTSSQKLPPTINFRSILESLSGESRYQELTAKLLKRENLVPNEGKKQDSAHPAIYPTGNLPERILSGPEKHLWDLIVKRFMAVFGEPALKQTVKVYIAVDGHRFLMRGSRILKEGWITFYKPYIQIEEIPLPRLEKGEDVEIKDIALEEKFTKPPSRYNPSSLLKKMEDEGIGTKATRADIIETLYNRMYVKEERMIVSDLGFDVIDILSSYCPEILSANFTKELEDRMEEIQNSNEKMENVLRNAMNRLKPALEELKTHEKSVGQVLSEAIRKARIRERILGNCPMCVTGELMIFYSKRTGKRFVGCTNFFKGVCKASFPLPQNGIVKPFGKNCQTCSWPMIQFKLKGKRSWTFCINPNCASKGEKINEVQNLRQKV